MRDTLSLLGPAVLLAVLIRLDAKFVGPYFALSELVGGFEGIDAQYWYEDSTFRNAVMRRFLWPLVGSMVLSVLGWSLAEVVVVALLVVGLLLWPAVFHGLPLGVSRRDWEVPALYGVVALLFGASAASGYYLVDAMRGVGGGSLRMFIQEYVVPSLLWLVLAGLASIYVRSPVERLRDKRKRRAESASAHDAEGYMFEGE